MDGGYYYLHINGDLIHKPSIVTEYDSHYFDSPFVKKVWGPLDIYNRVDAWKVLLEALANGASMERIKELAQKWNCDYDDSIEMLRRVKPTDDMQKGMDIFIKEILGMEIENFWAKVKEDWEKINKGKK
jgi:hypothetical protein